MNFGYTLRLLRRAGAFARPYRLYLGIVLTLTLLIAALGAIEPLVLKFIFDSFGKEDQLISSLIMGVAGLLLLGLLQRFYDPTAGEITIDGCNIRTIKQDQLREQIGVVLQDALLFNESIRDNIAYGRPQASYAEIEAAARIAHAHEFITRTDLGYNTKVGDRGARLSAGERQRIAIARAILKDPSILIFDEATSALDAETEFLVQRAFEKVAKGRTTFVIAHRLSTVVRADRILVLKDGRILEQGSHEQLFRQKGYYASLVESQTSGLLKAA